MKSFRAEREKKNASTQLIVTLLVLLTSIVLVQLLPADVQRGNNSDQKSSWESSVVKLP